MSVFHERAESVAAEIREVLARVDDEQIQAVIAALDKAKRVFVIGVGRDRKSVV